MPAIRVCIAEALPLLREGIVCALQREPDIEVVGTGTSTGDAADLVRELTPDVLVVGVNTSDDITRISSMFPTVKCLVLARAFGEAQVRAALKAGAGGFALDRISVSDLVQAVRAVANKKTYIDSGLAAQLFSAKREEVDALAELSCREVQVLNLIAQGLSNKEVGRELLLTEKTVKHYVTNMLQKLQVRNRVQAAMLVRVESRALPDSPPAQSLVWASSQVHSPAL
jgi:DNA-binding NarL/FixJ family response regulator